MIIKGSKINIIANGFSPKYFIQQENSYTTRDYNSFFLAGSPHFSNTRPTFWRQLTIFCFSEGKIFKHTNYGLSIDDSLSFRPLKNSNGVVCLCIMKIKYFVVCSVCKFTTTSSYYNSRGKI